MDRYAVVADGVVVNVALWDGTTEWTPAGELVALPADSTVGPGDLYDGKTFTPTVPPVPEPDELDKLAAQVAALTQAVASIPGVIIPPVDPALPAGPATVGR